MCLGWCYHAFPWNHLAVVSLAHLVVLSCSFVGQQMSWLWILPEFVQVLVLDLDQTIVHTPFEPLEQRALASYQDRGRVFDVALKGQTQPCMFCAPRAYLVQFFCKLYYKCHVMYCTAGSQQYGNDVISNLRAFMLGTPDLDDHQREWIMSITDPRCAEPVKAHV